MFKAFFIDNLYFFLGFQEARQQAPPVDDIRVAVPPPEELRRPSYQVSRSSPSLAHHRQVRHSQEDRSTSTYASISD
jgi:hypothetical protein